MKVNKSQPCLIVKLNKVFGWEPEPFYNLTEVPLIIVVIILIFVSIKDLGVSNMSSKVKQHPKMPDQLKQKIEATWEKHCSGSDKEDRSMAIVH